MAGNPQIAQGTLNRIRGSAIFPLFPTLNVTAGFLGKAGIGVALQGETTVFIPTLTGAVTSPEPYQIAMVTLHLLKTQNLAGIYKARMELDARVGDMKVIPDAVGFPSYDLVNCAIASVREMSFAGDDAGFVVSMHGYYQINSDLFNLL